jgi:hypothetical protein
MLYSTVKATNLLRKDASNSKLRSISLNTDPFIWIKISKNRNISKGILKVLKTLLSLFRYLEGAFILPSILYPMH